MTAELVAVPKQKELKVKFETIDSRSASDLIPEIFKLFEQTDRKYPSYKNESRETLIQAVYSFCIANNSCGVLLRIGRKPAALLLGNVIIRPFGSPKRFGFVWKFYADEQVSDELKKKVWATWHKLLREREVMHWEMDSESEPFIPYKILYQRVGGTTEE